MVVPGGSTKDDLFLGSNHRACDVNAYHTHSKTVAFIDMHSSATNGFVVQVEVQTSYEKNKKSTNLIEFLFVFFSFFRASYGSDFVHTHSRTLLAFFGCVNALNGFHYVERTNHNRELGASNQEIVAIIGSSTLQPK